jgi:hypothetical protein
MTSKTTKSKATKPKVTRAKATKAIAAPPKPATETIPTEDTTVITGDSQGGPPLVDDETVAAADASPAEKVDVIVKRVGGQVRIATISVNGRASRFRCNKKVTVTKPELEALQNAGAELEIIS